MGLRLYNTMGRTMQDFKPIKEGEVGFYGCGPTVYNYAHIGNLRAYVFLDILGKTLTYLGYKINHVMNITDVGHLTDDADDGEDRMVKTAQERHQSVLEIAKFYTDVFHNDIDALNIRRPNVECKATEHIPEMIELIKKLEKNGNTYFADGNLYFDISTYADYGKLARLNLDELKAGAGRRAVSVIDANKRNPNDFVLWFTKSKFENQAMTWDSPWGRGYPGWHVECSAMSMKYLGKHFDIHTGGIDHIPVHHTNEIAQSESSFSKEESVNKDGSKKPWVNYWLHNEFLILDGGKMSKSKGYFITLQTSLPEEKGYSLKDKGFEPLDYRFFLLGAHYRKQLLFSLEAMESAKAGRASLNEKVAKLILTANSNKVWEKIPALDIKVLSKENFNNVFEKYFNENLVMQSEDEKHFLNLFTESLENDLNTPKALAALNGEIASSSKKCSSSVLANIWKMDKVLSLDLLENGFNALEKQNEEAKAQLETMKNDPEIAKITELILAREEAKKNKDFAKADEIRNHLSSKGIILKDTPQGTTWHRA
ncbi:MAG: cysteine--tRNA ligase [Treponema sp.]|nr:cysteine--tRNA ligase [Treponema sp.]